MATAGTSTKMTLLMHSSSLHVCDALPCRDADPHFGLWQAKDMQINMEDSLSNLPLEILQASTGMYIMLASLVVVFPIAKSL
jgi:hypothetical protein